MKKAFSKKLLAILLVLSMVLPILPVNVFAATYLATADGWTIVNENDNLTLNDETSITITTEKGDLDGKAVEGNNYWIRTPEDENFTLTAKISGGMYKNYHKAGIMVYKDSANIASVVRRYHTGLALADGSKPGYVLGMFQYLNGYGEPRILDTNPNAPVWLKLVKDGSKFTGYYRYAETDEWTQISSITNATVASASDMKIGVYALNGTGSTGLDVTIEDFTYQGENDTEATVIPFAVDAEGLGVESFDVASSTGRTVFGLNESVKMAVSNVLPSAAMNKSVTWSVAPADTASITADGVLTATAAGTYTVTATAADGGGAINSTEISFGTGNAWTVDETTLGDWIGTYGSDGYVLCAWDSKNDIASLPYYIEDVSYSFQNRSGGYVARTAANSSATGWNVSLPHPDDPDGTRKLAYQFDDKAMTVHITATDSYEHQLTLYSVSENDRSRKQTVLALDPETGLPISDAVTTSSMQNGRYYTITFAGSIDVLLFNENYNPLNTNVIVNGIFFDTAYGEGDIAARELSIAPADGEVVRTDLEAVQMTATIWPKETNDKSVTWSVDNEDIAEVDANGLVTIKQAGAFTITAVANSNRDLTDSVSMVAMDSAAVPDKAEVQLLGDAFAMIQNPYVRVLFNLESGYYSVYEQGTDLPYVLNAYFQVNAEKSYKGYDFAASEIISEDGKTLRLSGSKTGCDDLILDIGLEDATGDILMRAGITNHSGKGVKVMQMYPMAAKYAEKGGIFVGPNPAENHALLTGEGNWTVPQVKEGVSTTSKNNLLLSYRNNPDLATFLIGQLTTYSFQSTITTAYNADNNFVNNGRNSVDADIRIYDNTGKLVDDGATYVGDVALINFTTKNPYDVLDEYAWRQAEVMEVDLIDFDPYIYECLWYVNWFTSNANNADFAVQEVKDLYEKGLANYATPNIRVEPDSYVNPNEQLWWDDEHWLSFGHLTQNYPTAKAWITAMKAAGGEGGLYMQASYRSDDYCAEYPGHMIGNVASGGPDYTDPEFIAHMADVYANLKDAGVRSIFYDYAGQYKGTGGGYLLNLTGGFEDKYATAVEAYRNIFALPKTYIGSDVRITENSWEYSGSDLAIGLIDIQRNIGDTNEFNPDIAKVALNQWYRHRKTKLLYSDVKVFENDNVDLRRAQITGTGFFFGKTTLGESVNLMSDAKIKDIGKIVPFPVDGIAARPVGLFEKDYQINPYVMDYKFDSEYDDHILLFWNQDGKGEKEISADLGLGTAFGGIGLDADKEYEVWDFWNWKYVGTYKGSDILTQVVRDNEMRTMALREVREVPYLLSTNRHVLQGTEEIDVKAFAYDEAAKTVTGTFDIVGNDTYKAIIALGDSELLVDSFAIDNEAVTGSAKLNVENNYVEITLDAAENQTVNFTLELVDGNVDDDTTAPSAITGLTSWADDYGIVTLNWNPSVDEYDFVQVTYEVYGGTAADFAADENSLLAITTANTFTDSAAHTGDYYYKVRALDGVGNATEFALVKTNAEVLHIDLDTITMTAGDSEDGEGPARVLDNKTNTLWHTNWDGTDRANMWIDMKFAQPTLVNTYDYLPRATSSRNGVIKEYELYASTDNGASYEKIASGEWDTENGWKTVYFDDMVVTNLRLYAITSVGNYASAAEIRAYRTVQLTGIELRTKEVTLDIGGQTAIEADLYPTNLQGAALTYVSDNDAVATVNDDGIVTAVSTGVAVITVSTENGLNAVYTVTVNKEPEKFEIVTQPVDVAVAEGKDAVVTVEATGEGLTYTWYYKNPGNVKFYLSGEQFVIGDGSSYSIPMYAWRDGQEVYCVITDENGETLQTNIVTISMVKPDIVITKQPVDVVVANGKDAVVTVAAEGEGLTYTWYYKNPGNVKFYLSGEQFVSADGTTYTIPMAAWRDGQQVYCVITNAAGDSVQTNIVTLTME